MADFWQILKKIYSVTPIENGWFLAIFEENCSKKAFCHRYQIGKSEKKNTREFFLGGGCGPFFKMINIFACTCLNRPGVGAIDNPDRFEKVFDTYYIPETSEEIFMDDISMVHP